MDVSAARARPERGAARPAGTPGPAPRSILRVRVGRLVVEGIAPADQARMTAALAVRLGELVDRAPDFDWASVRGAPRIDGGVVAPRTAPAEIGRHLAFRIFRGLVAAQPAAAGPGDEEAGRA